MLVVGISRVNSATRIREWLFQVRKNAMRNLWLASQVLASPVVKRTS